MKSTESAIEYPNKSISPTKSPVKPSGALNRLNTLSDKIYQGEYSPRNLLTVTDLTIDTKTALKIIGSISLFMLGCQLRWNDHPNFAATKLLWLVSLLSYFYLFPPKNLKDVQKQLIIFFGLRLLSSTIVCSVFSGVPLTYEFHIESQEQDTLINLFFTMLAALLIQREMLILRNCLIFQLAGNTIIILGLQCWYKVFDVTIFLRQIALFMGFTTFYQLMSARSTMDRKQMEATVHKNWEDISQELNEIKQKLEEESQATLADPLYTSKVDELVMKIKYLKFSLLQKEKEKTFLKGKQVFTNARRKTYITPSPGPYSPYFEKRSDETLFPSAPVVETRPVVHANTGNTRNDLALRWGISARDCDSLVKLILEKQVIMWYPEIVKRQDNQHCKETAEFLKQHFTEVGNSLLNTNLSDQPKQPANLASKCFDCSPWSSYLESNICTWNFDMLKFKELTNSNHIIEFGSALMKKFDILKTLNTSPAVVTNFLRDVSDSYLPNPYHNSIHGADVSNGLGYFLVHKEFGGHFNELEKSCLLISGLVHDLGHPGLNNAFLVATRSTEALIYNDQSVLENFHAASFFKIIQKSCCNILENLSEKDSNYFRKLAINVILDTDLNKHFVILSKFKNNADSLNLAEENDRFLSLSIALKCADVSHGAKELNLHKRWSRRITEEFFSQGDKEKENNIPVTPLCDRTGNVSRSQHGFLTFIVLPLFEVLDQKFFNEEMKKTVTDQIRTNINYWNEEIPKEDGGEKNFMDETKKILEDIAEEAASGK